MPQLPPNHKQRKHREQDIIHHEIVCAERVQERRVALEKHEEDREGKREIRAPGVESGAEGER